MLRVLIAGGGVAGLEALLALRDLAGDRVELTLLSPEADFVYRPMAVAEPFGRGRADRHPLADVAADVRAELIHGALAQVDAPNHVAITATGQRLSYDALLVAVGADSEPAFRHVLTWTPETDADLFGGLLRDLDEGYLKRVAFVVPPGVAWALPAYELALMTAWQAWGMGHDDVQVMLYTPEDAPLGLFGTQATVAVRHDLEEAGVQAETGVYVAEDAQTPAGSSFIPERGRSTPSESSRCPGRSDLACRGFPPTPVASCPPTCTAESPTSTRSGRPATQSPSRSNRAGSRPSRPTRRPSRSPPMPAPSWSPAPTDRCSAA